MPPDRPAPALPRPAAADVVTVGTLVKALLHKVDFERMLAAPQCSRSAHFAVHHVTGRPAPPGKRLSSATAEDLSTEAAPACAQPVDDSAGAGQWGGCVVPKRHARRAVTRNLLRRQIRAALDRHAARLPAGLWLVRLKSPFAPKLFPAASSEALRLTARTELDALLARAAR